MKKMWKRFVSLLLACTLLAGMLPLSASAAGENRTKEKWENSKYGQQLKQAGYEFEYGYELEDTDIIYASFSIFDIVDQEVSFAYVFAVKEGGTFTSISNFQSGGAPWSNMLLGQVYIEDEVTGIGSNAFGSMPTLETVVFEDASKLTYIGQRAFYDDDNAVFTDEGNEGKTTTLNLSGVTTMGEYAFYNCDRIKGVELSGNITAVETKEGGGTEDIKNKIPNHAFNNSGLQTVNIPEGIVTIGDGAFAHTSLSGVGELVLPDGLQTIGDNAFVATMGEGDTSSGITSLTIPSTVTSIGVDAFSGRRNLQTVTVEDDKKADTKLTLGDGAFGMNEFTAYATEGTIRDEENPEIEYSGTIGTKFFLPADLEKYFINEVKCYTGDITPMKFDGTVPANCVTPGYDIYKTTYTGITSDGKPVELTYHYEIPALGHDYDKIIEVKRTCENDNYFVQYCLRDNCPNKGVAVGSLRQNQAGPGLFDENTDEPLSDEELGKYREQFKKAEGHNWKVKSVVNPNMQEQQTTTLYYVCENEEHSNSLDTYESPFEIPLSGKTIHALTTQSLNDLTNQLTGFSNDGMVKWATPSDEKFGEEGERNEPVTFTIQTGVSEEWPVFTEAPVGEPEEATGNSEKLTVKINVTKDVLDLSGVSIVPNAANVGKPVNVQVSGFEEAEETGSVEYYVNGQWTDAQPTTEGKYQVRVTFEYDEKMYDLPEENASEYPGEGYTLVNDEDSGSVWVEHSFEVSLNQINATAVAIPGVTYNGQERNTLSIYGLESGQKAVVTATDKDGEKTIWEYTRQENDPTTYVEGLPLLSAGTYNVKIVFSFPGHDEYAEKVQELIVHIDHKPVEKPTPTQNMSYLPVKTPRDAFAEATSADWEFVDDETYTHTGIDAGDYKAKVKLLNENYRWADESEEVREIEIPWKISPRQIVAPTIIQGYYTYQHGAWRNPLSLAESAHNNYEFVTNQEDNTVKLVYIRNESDENYDSGAAVAYTATNAYHTNRNVYTVIVTLNNSGNYVWWNGTPQNLTWTIAPATLALPNISAQNATYTGQPYEAETLVTVKDDAVTLPGDVKGAEYQYSHDSSFMSPSSTAPTNAGTYYVRQNYTYNNQNYIAQIPYASFTINKAPATMEFSPTEVTETYTAEGTALQPVTVTDLLGNDKGQEETVKGEVQYSYKYSQTPVKDWSAVSESMPISDSKNQKFTKVGYYQITAKWGAGTVSNNYTATDATYTLTITQAANQSITLTPDKINRWTAASDSALAEYTIEYGKDATFTVIGEAALDDAVISYKEKADSEKGHDGKPADVLTVRSDGKVTIEQAGTATITVKAADTANVAGTSVDYTVTVKKAKPTVSLTDNKLEVPYTGQPIEGYNIATATANVVEGADQPTGTITYTFYTDAGCQNKVTNGGGKDGNIPIAVGTYYMKATYPGDKNYTFAESEVVTVTVTEAKLTVKAKGYTDTYDGDEHDPASITVTGVDGTSFEEDNYTVSYIEKGSDGEAKPDVDNSNWNPGLKVKDVADSGDYWIKVVIKNDDSYDPYIESVTVDIDPQPLTVTKTVEPTKEYDGTVDAMENVDFTHIDTGINGETVTANLISAVYNSANANVDNFITITYQLTADPETDTDLANYSLDGKAVTGAEMSEKVDKVGDTKVGITPAPITVAINDQEKVYDGSVATPSQSEWSVNEEKLYDVDNDGIKDNLDITLSIDSDSDAKNAGAYAIIGEADNKNYKVTFTGNWKGEEGDPNNDHAGTYTIDPRPIDVKIGDAEGFYGDAPDLMLETKVILTPETAQGEEAGLVNGEKIYSALEGLSLGSNATVSSPVGSYRIYPVNKGSQIQVLTTPTQLGNYNVTFTNEGTYTVKQRPITITIADQESDYGCEIAKLAYSETLSNTYTGTNENVVFVGDDETDLKIALFTTAKKGSDAGTYPISGEAKAESSVVSNYAITWKGQTPYQENEEQATYTVKKATLAVEFTNEEVTVSMGGTVNNPLKFINQSNSDEELGGQPQDVTVKYSSNDQGVATVNETTGEITLVGTGNATITAEVTSGGKNFTEGAKDSYIIHVAEDGGLLVTVTPKTLTYTGEMQNLISYSTAPAGAEVTFKVEAQTEGDRCQIASDDGLPQGQDAGTYRVSWVAKLQGYRDATGSTTVTIAKASPTTGFSKETVSVPYEENGTFDSTEETTLNVADDYNGTITYMSNDTRVASVQGNSLENISLNGTGSATITAVFTETDNYTAATASFRITVGTAETTISYTAEDYSVEYDRTAHGSKITVNSPSEYTIMYSDNNGTSYDLNESPTITDAGDLTIYFQIQADGYNSASGTQKVTVEPKEITANMIAGIAESYTYTGKEITFDDAISVHDEGVLLEKDKDYTITYDDNKEVGKGSVTITGTGNYKESVTKNFEITPVDASDLTASLDRTFGYYRNSETNNATVTVMHGSHTVDSSEITLTVTRQDSTIESGDVVKEGLKLTFNKAGIYTIHVVVAGTHTGTFDLTYTLLPQDVASDDFQVTTNPVGRVWTYDGENRAFGVTVTSGGTSLQKDVDFTLRYTYLPYVGSQEENEYDPESTEFTEAGIYTVIVEGTGNYTGHAELVALIQPRDLSDAGVTATFAQTELVYNGEAQEPGVTLTYNGTAITQLKDTEYYGNTNAGEAQALSAAREDCNNFTGARVDAFTIEKKSLKDSTITAKADPEEYYYTGYPVTPAVTVTDSDRNVDLSIGADYTVSSDAVGPGKVTATVTGTGNYKDTVTVEFTILPTGAEPVETLNLTVTPSEWTWDNGQTKAAISVTFNGTELNDTDYQLTVSKDGETPKTVTKAEAVELLSAPGKYTITATGVGAYNGSTDTETVTIQKIQPEVTVTATPNSLSGGGKVTLTLKGEKLPDGTDLKNHLKVTAKNDNDVTLEDLHIQWPKDGSLTAELTLPNTNETYTFTLRFVGNEYYEPASSNAMVVVGQQTSGGGGGSDPGDQPADPDDTGVSDWLNTKDHLAYLAGYPGGTFGPDQNMTRAEAAQMFYNLLLEKDVEITVEFEDVPADAWYAKPVNTLASLGILSGVGNGRFDPERSITRAEFTVIAMKFANTSGGGVNIFSDVNEDDWFYSAVVDSTQYGWINGYPDGTFRPEATISRAEVTVIVNHMLGRAADRPYVIAHEEELNTFGDVNRGHWGYFHVAEATNAHEYHTEDGTESWTGLS